MDIWPQLLLQAVLILVNAFFAATEIAIISLNDNLLRRQAEDGDKKAIKLLKLVESPTRFLSTIQVGITLAGFLGSAFAADNFAGRITAWAMERYALTAAAAGGVRTLSVVLITVVLAFFTLIFGELVPKRLAMQRGEKVADFVCAPISALSALMRPADAPAGVAAHRHHQRHPPPPTYRPQRRERGGVGGGDSYDGGHRRGEGHH